MLGSAEVVAGVGAASFVSDTEPRSYLTLPWDDWERMGSPSLLTVAITPEEPTS